MSLTSIECPDPVLLQEFTGAFIADLIFSNNSEGRQYLSTLDYEIPNLIMLSKLSRLWVEPEVAHNYSLFTIASHIDQANASGSARVRLYQLIARHRQAKAAIYIAATNFDQIEKRIRVHVDTRIKVVSKTRKAIHFHLISVYAKNVHHSQVPLDLIPYRGKVWDAWYQLR